MEKFYITTTLPYINAEPHIGFALEIVQADAIARHKRAVGKDVFFNTGTDEHGLKIYRAAEEKGKSIGEYCGERAAKFAELKGLLNLSYDNFIRTTDEHHVKAAREFWRRCFSAGDIYKAEYEVKYCVGCELEKSDSELENGKCPLHPSLDIEHIKEENYFFRFSKYQSRLLEFYENNRNFVIPEKRFNEIKKFVAAGLKDFSVSRLKSKLPWGVPVPDDPDHVMYVWFDALVNYVSAVGWPEDADKFNYWWPGTQIAGKDNLRQQSAMWQAMLMSAGLPNSSRILIHGFITSGGRKMSKTLGNAANPFDVVSRYGTDALRYYLLREIHPFEDGDFTEEKFKEAYNANLANGLGNLVSRIMKMSENYLAGESFPDACSGVVDGGLNKFMEGFELNKAMDKIWEMISELDARVQEEQPFKLIKEDEEKAKGVVRELVSGLGAVAEALEPFLPETAEKIKAAIGENKMPEPLFLRAE